MLQNGSCFATLGSCGLDMESRRQCKIVLMNGRKFDITIQPKLLTQELLEIAMSHLFVKEYWYFGLYVQDGPNIWWLRNHIFVLDHDFLKIEGVLTLYLGIRFFIRNVLSIKDARAVELHYLQANKLFSLGQLAVNDKEAVRLASLVFQTEFGDFVNNKDYLEKCSKSKLLSHLECTRPRIFWEEKIKSEYMKISGESRGKAAIEFLRIVCNNPMYGVHFFSLKDARGKPCWLGLSHKGILMYEGNEKAKPIRTIEWEVMGNILYKGKRLSIEAPKMNNSPVTPTTSTPNSTREGNKILSSSFSDQMIVYIFQAPSETICERIWNAFIDQHQFYLSFTQRAVTSKEIPQLAEQLNNVFTFAEGIRPSSFSSESSTHAKELVGHLKSKREQLNLLLQAKMKHLAELEGDIEKVESVTEMRDRAVERSRQEDHVTLCHLNELLFHNERVTMGYYKLVVLINKTISTAAKKMISVQALIDKPNVSASAIKSRWIEEYTKSLGKLKKVETKVNKYRKMFELPVINVASRCEDHKITKTPVSRTGMSNQCLCQNHSQEFKTKQDSRDFERIKNRQRSCTETSRTTTISSSSVRLRLEAVNQNQPEEKPDLSNKSRQMETVDRNQQTEMPSRDRPMRQLSNSKTNQSPSIISTADSVSSSSSSFSHQFFPSGTDSASSSSSSSAFSQYLPPPASGIVQNGSQLAAPGGLNAGKLWPSQFSDEGMFKVPIGLPPRSVIPSTETNKKRLKPYDDFELRGNRIPRWGTIDATVDERQAGDFLQADDCCFRGLNNMYSVSTKKIIHYPAAHSSSVEGGGRMATVEFQYCPQCKKNHRQRHQSQQVTCPRSSTNETARSMILHVPPTQQFAAIYANQAEMPLDSDEEEDFIPQMDQNSLVAGSSAKNVENKRRKPIRKSDWLYGWACPLSGEVARLNPTDEGSNFSNANDREKFLLPDHYYQSLSSVQTPAQPSSSSIKQKSSKKLPSTAANLASCFKTFGKDLNEAMIESPEANRHQRVRDEATPRSAWRDRDLKGGILTAYSSPPEHVKTDLTICGVDLSLAQPELREREPPEMERGRRNYGVPPFSVSTASELDPVPGKRQEALPPEIARGDGDFYDFSHLHLELSMRRNPYLEHQLKEKEFDACMRYFARMQLEHVGVFSGRSLNNKAAGFKRYMELEQKMHQSNDSHHNYDRQQSQQTPQSHHHQARDSGTVSGRTPGNSSGHRSRSIQSRKSRTADSGSDRQRHPSTSPA